LNYLIFSSFSLYWLYKVIDFGYAKLVPQSLIGIQVFFCIVVIRTCFFR
jgi:hypothetical protein